MNKAIVVGATSGIGRELADILVKNNYKVGITGRRMHLLEEIKSENPDNYFIKCFDVRDIANIKPYLDDLTCDLGGLDLLIILSAIVRKNECLDFEVERDILNTNVLGFTCVADWGINFFEDQTFGHLVAVSSISGLRGNRFATAYGASKAYQINYLEALRGRVSQLKYPIYVTDIRPGFVDTVMAGDIVFWLVSVKKAGSQIFDSIKKKKRIVYVSKRWKLFAWALRTLPVRIHQKI